MQNQRSRFNTNESLRELIHDYNENINYYNSNMRRLIEIAAINDIYSNTNRNYRSNTYRNRQNDNYTNIQNLFTNTIRRGLNQFRNNIQTTFEDVIVRPTSFQINNAVETLIFDPNHQYSNAQYPRIFALDISNCPITMTEFEAGNIVSRIRTCGHIFSQDALTNWFSRNVRCPMCRFDIRETPIDIQSVAPTPAPLPASIPVTPDIRTTSEVTDEQMSYLERELDNLANQVEYNTPTTSIINDISENSLSSRTNVRNFTNLLSSFIQNELQDNLNISELIYTFSIPFDSSNNLYHQ